LVFECLQLGMAYYDWYHPAKHHGVPVHPSGHQTVGENITAGRTHSVRRDQVSQAGHKSGTYSDNCVRDLLASKPIRF